jgi:hypothetical protein
MTLAMTAGVCGVMARAVVGSFVDAPTTMPTCPVGNWSCTTNAIQPVFPIGNPPATASSFSLHGVTSEESLREYLVDFGLVSNKGSASQPPTTPCVKFVRLLRDAYLTKFSSA